MVDDDGIFDTSSTDQVARMTLAVDNSGTGIWDRDIVSGRMSYSRAWTEMLGYDAADVGDRIDDAYLRVHPDDLAMVQATIKAHFDGLTAMYEVEHRLRCKDGSYKWVLSRGKVVDRGPNGKPLRMTGVTTDLSHTVALSEKLRKSAELLTNLTDEVPGVVYQYREAADGQSSFPYASAGILELFGVTPAQAAASAAYVEAVIHPEDAGMYRASLVVSAETLERWHLEFRVVLPYTGERWCQGDARPRRQSDGSTVWHGFVSDVTERKQIERQLQEAAATDFLTGLPNRRHIMSRMEQQLAQIQRDVHARAAVLMFDLDHFKVINDLHGHAMGDEVLRHFSRVLQDELRKVDSAGRIGGEEFAVLLSDASMEDAIGFAERVRARLVRSPLSDGEHCMAVTVSIGISAMYPDDLGIVASLSSADAALYRAKQAGRDRIETAPPRPLTGT